MPRMDNRRCPRCEFSVDSGDHYCRDCGWSLRLQAVGEAKVVSGVPVSEPSVLPILRTDLAPVVPSMKRGAAVIATAVIADWALRTGGRALLREGMALLGHGQSSVLSFPRPTVRSNGAFRSGTVIVEQRVTIHKGSTR